MGVIAGRVLCSSTLPAPFTASSNSASTYFQTGLQEFLGRPPRSTVTRILSRGPRAAAQSAAFWKIAYSKHQAPPSLVTHRAPWEPGTMQKLDKESIRAPNLQVPAFWQCCFKPQGLLEESKQEQSISTSRAEILPASSLLPCTWTKKKASSPAPRSGKEDAYFIFDLFDIVSRSHRVNSQFIKSLTPWVLSLCLLQPA